MLLVIDIGNTNSVIALLTDEGEVKGKWRLSSDSHRTADEYGMMLKGLMADKGIASDSISDVIISSVVPQNLFALKTCCSRYFSCEPMIVNAQDVRVPMAIKIEQPQELGADRLVNALAGYDKYKTGLVVIDFGTATTFDVVSKEGDYLGGLIAPGINLSLDALHQAAAALPEIGAEKPKKIVGKNTTQAMQSGIYYGYIGLIEGIVARIKEEQGDMDMQVIATGGLAPLFMDATDTIHHLEPELTIRGLYLLYQLNK